MPYVFTVCFCRTYQYHAVVNKLQLFRVKGGGVPSMKKFPHQKVALKEISNYNIMLHMLQCRVHIKN